MAIYRLETVVQTDLKGARDAQRARLEPRPSVRGAAVEKARQVDPRSETLARSRPDESVHRDAQPKRLARTEEPPKRLARIDEPPKRLTKLEEPPRRPPLVEPRTPPKSSTLDRPQSPSDDPLRASRREIGEEQARGRFASNDDKAAASAFAPPDAAREREERDRIDREHREREERDEQDRRAAQARRAEAERSEEPRVSDAPSFTFSPPPEARAPRESDRPERDAPDAAKHEAGSDAAPPRLDLASVSDGAGDDAGDRHDRDVRPEPSSPHRADAAYRDVENPVRESLLNVEA